ncbi:InlB B-repeat-containing protein [Listeria marthii]|uniref:InlB B-repeat-containing protein n=1 Tax=Listeria marthii TaxID=529731 RepID=UPI001888B87C|nr:InlB B-repeat-containing protein [Listeria marthii]MBF2399811.1 InlB B-repeat-containing protein [Listeria marthii]MBF2676217.1 InlB B-repeat-containing protein [Listeria marthii]
MKRKISLIIVAGVILFQALNVSPLNIWAVEGEESTGNEETVSNMQNVIMHSNGRVTVYPREVGSSIPVPARPDKEGHTFVGWFEEPTGGNPWNFDTPMPATEVNLYAQFRINSYIATLISEERTATQNVVYQETVNEPTKPKKEGYTFTGWYDAETGGQKWDFATDKMPGKNMTLYAQFRANAFPVNFTTEGKATTQIVDYPGVIKEPTAPTKVGYKFMGWYDAETGGNKWDFQSPMQANEVTLYAQFSLASYTATLNADGTTTTQTTDYEGLLEEPAAPTKEGYTFIGWYDAKTGGNKWDFQTNKMPAKDVTLYAQFSKNAENNVGNPAQPAQPIQPIAGAAAAPANTTADPKADPAKANQLSKKLPLTGNQENVLYLLSGLLLIGGALLIFKKNTAK